MEQTKHTKHTHFGVILRKIARFRGVGTAIAYQNKATRNPDNRDPGDPETWFGIWGSWVAG